MGSPQGIAQGYASVLENLAHHLEELAHEETITRLSEMLIEILPKRENCRVCQVAAGVESRALDEIAKAEPAAGTSRNLCFIHLVALLPSLKNLGDAKRWMQTEAVQFRRLAQDMRQFALKHNALRRYLATEGEQNAYLYGLTQLVGARQLSFVRKVQDLL